MLNAIHHIFVLLFGQPQRMDFWLLGADLLIVALIVWVDVPEKLHKRGMRKRVASLFLFMEKGQDLERAVVRPSHNAMEDAVAGKIQEWMISVRLWSQETHEFLKLYSPRAAAAFVLIAEPSILTNPQIVYNEDSSFPIVGPEREAYQKLIVQLGNLRNIMEKPDAYF